MVFRSSFALGVLLALATSCGAPQLKLWDQGEGEPSKLRCMDTGRDVLGLEASQRAKLARDSARGVVAVRYTEKGCNVELELLECYAEAKYEYQPYSHEDHKTAYRSGDLWAQLPLGAARLGAGLHDGEALKKDVLMVGTNYLPPDAPIGALKGRGCTRANYVVKSITVGGFAIHRGAREAIDASASLFGVGAGTQLAQGVQRHDGDGSLDACLAANKSGQPSPQCAAPLKIELLAIEGREPAPSAPPEPLPEPPRMVERPAPLPEPPPPAPKPAPRPVPVHVESPPPSPPPVAAAGMVRIPGGSFLMGANDISDDERPPHQVTVGAFELDLTEVTVAAYRQCVTAGGAGGCTTEGLTVNDSCNWNKPDRANHPINCVDWNQATAYCRSVNKRLPTEREWEFAARGPEGRKYPWGDAAPGNQLCWNGEGSDLGKGKRQSTCPVGRYRSGASPFGALDMAGNVWEWTSSAFCKPESNSCAESARVYRGGGWYFTNPDFVRGASRFGYEPSDRGSRVGLRCAR